VINNRIFFGLQPHKNKREKENKNREKETKNTQKRNL
jgi:hypothetical protein